MGMTLTQKILARHADLETVSAGQLIEARLDLVLGNDVTAPPAIATFEKNGVGDVFDPSRIALVPDHFTPSKDIASAENCARMRRFAREKGIEAYYEMGEEEMGIEHVVLPENGLIGPYEAIVGADSHTCTYGALGAFATGVGSTDLAYAMATGGTWFRVPEAIHVWLTGELPADVSGKDVMLTLIGRIGVDGARYQSIEFDGPGITALAMSDRLTIANMAIEAGAKNGIFPVDEQTVAYLERFAPDKAAAAGLGLRADPDAVWSRTVAIDLAQVRQVVALPHLPENVKPIDEVEPLPIDQVVIGSCTNGRLEDMRVAASWLKGRHVAKGVRLIILPGSQRVWRACLEEGLTKIFDAAGAVIAPATCGPCLGGHMGVLANGERCVSTTNRNFIGRMGHPGSEVYLVGVPAACASAVLGHVAGSKALKGEAVA